MLSRCQEAQNCQAQMKYSTEGFTKGHFPLAEMLALVGDNILSSSKKGCGGETCWICKYRGSHHI